MPGYRHHKAIGPYLRKRPAMPRGKFLAGIAVERNHTESNLLMPISLCRGVFLRATPEASRSVQSAVPDVLPTRLTKVIFLTLLKFNFVRVLSYVLLHTN